MKQFPNWGIVPGTGCFGNYDMQESTVALKWVCDECFKDYGMVKLMYCPFGKQVEKSKSEKPLSRASLSPTRLTRRQRGKRQHITGCKP